jgi:hypothetical protein
LRSIDVDLQCVGVITYLEEESERMSDKRNSPVSGGDDDNANERKYVIEEQELVSPRGGPHPLNHPQSAVTVTPKKS